MENIPIEINIRIFKELSYKEISSICFINKYHNDLLDHKFYVELIKVNFPLFWRIFVKIKYNYKKIYLSLLYLNINTPEKLLDTLKKVYYKDYLAVDCGNEIYTNDFILPNY